MLALSDPAALAPIIVAPFIGSFLGVAVRRLPAGVTVVGGRSACPHCRHQLAARDLVPVVSWFANRGKCRFCNAALGAFYPAIELAATTIAVLAVLATDGPASAWLACGLGWALLCLSWIDIETLTLPDILTLPLILVGLALAVPGGTPAMLSSGIAAAVGFAVLWLVARGYQLLARKPGLGDGDLKLFAAAGAWLGWQILPSVIFVASALGLVAAIIAMVGGRKVTRETRIPFGPFIAAAMWLGYLSQHPGDGFGTFINTYTGL